MINQMVLFLMFGSHNLYNELTFYVQVTQYDNKLQKTKKLEERRPSARR